MPRVDSQRHLYSYRKFEKCNAKLSAFNDLCAERYSRISLTVNKHTQLLVEAKQDLDHIYRRLRTLKSKLSERYPEQYAKGVSLRASPADSHHG
jgi:hypothetical protein